MVEDPSQLTDEELDKVLADVGQEVEEPESEEEEPQEEQEAPEEKEELPEPEAEPEKESEEEKEEERQPSRRETLRIQKLLQKYGDPEERVQQQPRRQEPNKSLNYSQELDADEEVVQRLEQDRQSYGDERYNEALAVAQKQQDFLRWETSLKIDNPAVEKKHSMLDKSSEDFHPAVADTVNTLYLKLAGFDPNTRTVANPNINYAEFVDSYMELVEETANVKNQKTVQNVTKQAAQTGLRPDGGTAKRLDLNKPFHQMTDEELDAFGKQNGLATKKRRI